MIYDFLAGKKSQDILFSEIAKTTTKNKALGLIGAALYIGLPLSYFFGVSGEIILNVRVNENGMRTQVCRFNVRTVLQKRVSVLY